MNSPEALQFTAPCGEPPLGAAALLCQASEPLAHLPWMSTQDTISTDAEDASLPAIVCLSELAAHLRVSIQTLFDRCSQGRGPREFRVGREVRFRRAEIETWLARLEGADRDRPPAQERAS